MHAYLRTVSNILERWPMTRAGEEKVIGIWIEGLKNENEKK